MPANTSGAHRLGRGTHPATGLVSVSGDWDPATPRDVERQVGVGDFFWLDLESLDRELLGQFGRSLRLGTSAMAELEETGQSAGAAMGAARARQQPSLTVAGDFIQGLVPAAGGLAPDAAPIPVWIVYTADFLLTVHSGPCPALVRARHRYEGLRDKGKPDGHLVLFLVLDEVAGSFQEQFLALDARLDEIQVELLTDSSPPIAGLVHRGAGRSERRRGCPAARPGPRCPGPPGPAPPARRPVDGRREGLPGGGQGGPRAVLTEHRRPAGTGDQLPRRHIRDLPAAELHHRVFRHELRRPARGSQHHLDLYPAGQPAPGRIAGGDDHLVPALGHPPGHPEDSADPQAGRTTANRT